MPFADLPLYFRFVRVCVSRVINGDEGGGGVQGGLSVWGRGER